MAETYTELEKRKILAVIGRNREMMKMACAKIYTSNKEGDNWLFSDLEGFLCFILDYNLKTRFLIMFDSESYEMLFQFELYNNFEKSYQPLADDFYCFELGNGFIGFKFYELNEAKMFNLVINKFENNLTKMLFDSFDKTKIRNFDDFTQIYCEILKEKFTDGIISFDENYIEDGLEIRKPRYFELMNNISYDREKKEFIIGKIPKEFKKMFKHLGVKKCNLKNPELALNIFKHFIETIDVLDNQKRERFDKSIFSKGMKNNIKNIIEINSNINNENLDSKSELTALSTGSSDSNMTFQTKNNSQGFIKKIKNEILKQADEENGDKKKNEKIITQEIKIENTLIIKNIPVVPNIPNVPKVPNIPIVPKVPILPKATVVPQINNNISTGIENNTQSNDIQISKEEEILKIKLKPMTNNLATPTSNIFDEIKKVQLKKMDLKESFSEKRPNLISKNESNILQSTLAQAILQRRIDLTRDDVSEGDEDLDRSKEDSDWSDEF